MDFFEKPIVIHMVIKRHLEQGRKSIDGTLDYYAIP